MEIPFLDLAGQYESLQEKIIAEVSSVLATGHYILGAPVLALEAAIGAYCGCDFAIGVSSGSDALLAGLMACDVQPGDLVITSPFTFFATAGAIARLNAIPIFLDIEPDYYTLCPLALENFLSEKNTPLEKVKAIIPVHLYGQMCNMAEIMSIGKQYDIPIIEDAAQSLGAKYVFKETIGMAGAMGTMGCFSFYPTKNLGGAGDGGMIVTSDSVLAEKLFMLRNHGAKIRNFHSLIGGNFRLDSIQAAVLNIKFTQLDAWNEQRRKCAVFYDDNLASTPLQIPALRGDREHHTYNQYVVNAGGDRDALQEFLKGKGIATEVYYPRPLHLQDCFSYLNYREGMLPQSEGAARSTLALPIYPELTISQREFVVSQIQKFYS